MSGLWWQVGCFGGVTARVQARALTALRTNLMRSILTTLGIMIGVFSVILAVAVGSGAQVSVSQQIATLGSNMAIVTPEPDSDGPPRRSTDRGRLTERDGQAIAAGDIANYHVDVLTLN